jgi:hypothetical protein
MLAYWSQAIQNMEVPKEQADVIAHAVNDWFSGQVSAKDFLSNVKRFYRRVRIHLLHNNISVFRVNKPLFVKFTPAMQEELSDMESTYVMEEDDPAQQYARDDVTMFGSFDDTSARLAQYQRHDDWSDALEIDPARLSIADVLAYRAAEEEERAVVNNSGATFGFAGAGAGMSIVPEYGQDIVDHCRSIELVRQDCTRLSLRRAGTVDGDFRAFTIE